MINTLFKYNPVAVRFKDRLERGEKPSDDLYCTALARSVKENRKIVIDIRRHKCAGGNYFAGGLRIRKKKLADVYICRERVVADEKSLAVFLKNAGINPLQFNDRYVIFEPFFSSPNKFMGHLKSEQGRNVIIGVADPEKVSRLLGLYAFYGGDGVDVVPAVSTCSAIYRPLIKPDKIHLNFIDYFDRNFQCDGFYTKDEIIVAMTPVVFARLLRAYNKSSHGALIPENMKIYDVQKLNRPQ